MLSRIKFRSIKNEPKFYPICSCSFFLSDWPNSAEQLDITIAVRCGFQDEIAKSIKAKKSEKQRGKKGAKKDAAKRAPETFQVCANGQMTFSPSVSQIFNLQHNQQNCGKNTVWRSVFLNQ